MKIIELGAGQLAEYKAFFTEGLVQHPEAFRISPEDEAAEPFPTTGTAHSFTLAAVDDAGMLAGVVSFKRETANRQKLAHKGLLFRMYVAGGHAGKGVGALLMQAVIERVQQLQNIHQINLTVMDDNVRAKALYSRFGFEQYGTERASVQMDAGYADEALMVLLLK